jgi:hypothetical protein
LHLNLTPILAEMREVNIKRIQAEYGYDRANAERLLEYQAIQGQEVLLNAAIGSFAAYKAGPFQDAAQHSYPLFRKAWMKVPIRLSAFGAAYYVASQLQTRVFPRLTTSYYRNGGVN